MSKNVIIVGAGASGLVAGIYARIAGFDVDIYESHTIVGGNCTGWNRNGYLIDGCIQWLTGTKKGTGINDIWRTCGALSDDTPVYNTEIIASTLYEGKMYHLYSDVNQMRQAFLEISPGDAKLIKSLVKNIRRFQNLNTPIKKPFEKMNFMNLLPLIWKMAISGRPEKGMDTMTIQDYLERFQSPIIKQLISCVFPVSAPLYALFYAMGIRSSGDGGWPMGGSMAFVKRMQQRFEMLGGRVYTRSAVDKILIEDGKAVGIRLEKDGREIKGDYIISAVDADVLLNRLLRGVYSDAFFKTRFEERKQDYLLLTGTYVSMGISLDLVRSYPHTIYIRPEAPLCINQTRIEDFHVKLYNYDPAFMQAEKTVMTVLLTEDEFDFWKALKARSAAEYDVEKERIAQWVMDGIVHTFSGLSGKIEVLDVATPLTFNRYCHTYRGAYMSFIPAGNVKKQFHRGTIEGVQNLFLAGQCTFPVGGMPLSAISGKFAAQRLIDARDTQLKMEKETTRTHSKLNVQRSPDATGTPVRVTACQ